MANKVDDTVSLDVFKREVQRALDEQRPDRYIVKDSTEEGDIEDIDDVEGIEWIDAIGSANADLLPEKHVKKMYAQKVAHQMERAGLRRGNNRIRQFLFAEQRELGWIEGTNYPVTIEHRIIEEGKRPRIRQERVRVGSMKAADVHAFVIGMRRKNAKDFATREQTCEAGEWIEEQLIQYGARNVDDWRDKKAAEDKAESDAN